MSAAKLPIECDFVAQRRLGSAAGYLLLALGIAALGAAGIEYRELRARLAVLESRAAAARHAQTEAARARAPAEDHLSPDVQQAARDLATPWTLLLAELEQAGKDSEDQVAVLGVEPDHGKHQVRISAEARDLPAALAYVQRLQSSRSIRFPMLDRHEIRLDVPQQPVRFDMTGQWRDQP